MKARRAKTHPTTDPVEKVIWALPADLLVEAADADPVVPEPPEPEDPEGEEPEDPEGEEPELPDGAAAAELELLLGG